MKLVIPTKSAAAGRSHVHARSPRRVARNRKSWVRCGLDVRYSNRRSALGKNVDDDFVKPGDPGSKLSIFFELLHLAVAIHGTHHKGVIVDLVWLPIKTPERPA